MNKKANSVCSKKDKSFTTVYDFLNLENLSKSEDFLGFEKEKIHTIGRLDKDTEGLLIFTTNGDLSHRLASPDSHVNKTYYVELEKEVSEKEKIEYKEKCLNGFFIPAFEKEKSFLCDKSNLEWISNSSCNLTIHEGKFHQVKRMFLELGNSVKYLKRISIGSLKLDKNLQTGEYRHLSSEEIFLLCKNPS
jgi:16S rRNA pseudouridine516 synthase